jgi:hypothetical protein
MYRYVGPIVIERQQAGELPYKLASPAGEATRYKAKRGET